MKKSQTLSRRMILSLCTAWLTEVSLLLYVGGRLLEALWPGSVLFFLPLEPFFWLGSIGVLIAHVLQTRALLFSSLLLRSGLLVTAVLFYIIFHPTNSELGSFRVFLSLGIFLTVCVYVMNEGNEEKHGQDAT